jgi:hypothetical protein
MDITKIIPNTVKVFSSPEVKEKMQGLPCINEEQYRFVHKQFLTPLDIKINVEEFIKDITAYDKFFQPWGGKKFPRYGIPLVNHNGKHNNETDPTNGSLTDWNVGHPENKFIETDFRAKTEIINCKSLNPLSIFDGTWCRSNILKWSEGGEFVPHIDAVIPCYWLRLWGTTCTEGFELSYYDSNYRLITVKDIEPGRIYLIDTTLIHQARSTHGSSIYQFFISVDPNAINLIKQLLC